MTNQSNERPERWEQIAREMGALTTKDWDGIRPSRRSDPARDLDFVDAETACKRIAELEATRDNLRQLLEQRIDENLSMTTARLTRERDQAVNRIAELEAKVESQAACISTGGRGLFGHLEELEKGISELEAENARYRLDMAEAAGELMVEMPSPGSLTSKLLSANVLMRRDASSLLAQVCDIEAQLEDALALLIVAESPRSKGVRGQAIGMTWIDRWTANRFRALDAAGVVSPEDVEALMQRVKDREERSELEGVDD